MFLSRKNCYRKVFGLSASLNPGFFGAQFPFLINSFYCNVNRRYTSSSHQNYMLDKKGMKKYLYTKNDNGTYYKPCFCFDIETTGLDFKKDKILEVSLLITDRNLDVVFGAGYDSCVKIKPEDILLMDEWAEKTHTDSGLLYECLSSNAKDLEDVDEDLYKAAKKVLGESEKGILLGNSVHFDRYFVQEHLPKFHTMLSHKIIDVTSFLEMKARVKPEMPSVFKKSAHRAKSDVSNSLRQIRNFKYNIFDKS